MTTWISAAAPNDSGGRPWSGQTQPHWSTAGGTSLRCCSGGRRRTHLIARRFFVWHFAWEGFLFSDWSCQPHHSGHESEDEQIRNQDASQNVCVTPETQDNRHGERG